MHLNRREAAALLAGTAVLPFIRTSTSAQSVAGSVAPPPRNPFLAQSSYPIGHADSAQSDLTADKGPVGPTRQLNPDEIRYHDLGMFNLGNLITGPYKDGKRAIWTNGSQYITKFDYDTFAIIASIRTPGSVETDTLTHENFIKFFDLDASFQEKFQAAKRSGFPPLGGIYILVDSDNQLVVCGKGWIKVYGDQVPGNRLSGIAERQHWDQPKQHSRQLHGNEHDLRRPDCRCHVGGLRPRDIPGFQGREVRAAAFRRGGDFPSSQRGSTSSATALQLTRREASTFHPTATFTRLSGRAPDFRSTRAMARGMSLTGTHWATAPAPPRRSLVSATDPDKLVVITDGDALMNMTVFWRDDVPKDWNSACGRAVAAHRGLPAGQLRRSEPQGRAVGAIRGRCWIRHVRSQ